jgi:hypothetical protein
MTVVHAFEELWDCLCGLREPLIALSVTVHEDRPADGDLMLADSLGDSVLEACGWLEGALGALRPARGAAGDPPLLRDALVAFGADFERLERTFWTQLAAYDRLAAVAALARERTEWRGWASGVRRGIDECASALHEARPAQLACWRELTTAPARSLLTINTTTIGQQLATPER